MVHKQSGIRCYIMSYERRFIMKKFVKVCLVGGVAAFCSVAAFGGVLKKWLCSAILYKCANLFQTY